MILYRMDDYNTYYVLRENANNYKFIRVNRYLWRFSSIRVIYELYNCSILDHVKPDNIIANDLVEIAEFDNIEDLKDLFPEEFI